MTIKKIFLSIVTIATLFIVGCKSTDNAITGSSVNSTMSSSFNEETYIWENWIFPTNKTTGQ